MLSFSSLGCPCKNVRHRARKDGDMSQTMFERRGKAPRASRRSLAEVRQVTSSVQKSSRAVKTPSPLRLDSDSASVGVIGGSSGGIVARCGSSSDASFRIFMPYRFAVPEGTDSGRGKQASAGSSRRRQSSSMDDKNEIRLLREHSNASKEVVVRLPKRNAFASPTQQAHSQAAGDGEAALFHSRFEAALQEVESRSDGSVMSSHFVGPSPIHPRVESAEVAERLDHSLWSPASHYALSAAGDTSEEKLRRFYSQKRQHIITSSGSSHHRGDGSTLGTADHRVSRGEAVLSDSKLQVTQATPSEATTGSRTVVSAAVDGDQQPAPRDRSPALDQRFLATTPGVPMRRNSTPANTSHASSPMPTSVLSKYVDALEEERQLLLQRMHALEKERDDAVAKQTRCSREVDIAQFELREHHHCCALLSSPHRSDASRATAAALSTLESPPETPKPVRKAHRDTALVKHVSTSCVSSDDEEAARPQQLQRAPHTSTGADREGPRRRSAATQCTPPSEEDRTGATWLTQRRAPSPRNPHRSQGSTKPITAGGQPEEAHLSPVRLEHEPAYFPTEFSQEPVVVDAGFLVPPRHKSGVESTARTAPLPPRKRSRAIISPMPSPSEEVLREVQKLQHDVRRIGNKVELTEALVTAHSMSQSTTTNAQDVLHYGHIPLPFAPFAMPPPGSIAARSNSVQSTFSSVANVGGLIGADSLAHGGLGTAVYLPSTAQYSSSSLAWLPTYPQQDSIPPPSRGHTSHDYRLGASQYQPYQNSNGTAHSTPLSLSLARRRVLMSPRRDEASQPSSPSTSFWARDLQTLRDPYHERTPPVYALTVDLPDNHGRHPSPEWHDTAAEQTVAYTGDEVLPEAARHLPDAALFVPGLTAATISPPSSLEKSGSRGSHSSQSPEPRQSHPGPLQLTPPNSQSTLPNSIENEKESAMSFENWLSPFKAHPTLSSATATPPRQRLAIGGVVFSPDTPPESYPQSVVAKPAAERDDDHDGGPVVASTRFGIELPPNMHTVP